MESDTLPGIHQISYGIRWIIEFQIVIAVPALMFSSVAIVTSELSGGGLLANNPTFVFIISAAQALGIEGAFFSNMIHSRQAFLKGKSARGIVMLLIGIVLCVITVLAIVAGNFESAFGLNTKEALLALGIGTALWAWIRAIVYGVVSFADAYMFYVPEEKLTEDETKARLEQMRLKAQIEKEKIKIRNDNIEQNAKVLKVLGIGKKKISEDNDEVLAAANDTDSIQQIEQDSSNEEDQRSEATVTPKRLINARNMWTWQDYQQFVDDTYHVTITQAQAKQAVRFIGGNLQDNEARGKPYIAEKAALKSYAKKTYASQKEAVSNE